MSIVRSIIGVITGYSKTEKAIVLFLFFSIFLYIANPLSISLVVGNSMEPTFDHGDVVVYSDYIEMEEGNMVVYEGEEGEMISHRLIEEKRSNVYVAKGDNNTRVDDTLVTSDNYRGTILFHINTSKYIPTEYLWKYY